MIQKSKQHIPAWVIALIFALALHAIAIASIYSAGWFATKDSKSTATTPKLEITLVASKEQIPPSTTPEVTNETPLETRTPEAPSKNTKTQDEKDHFFNTQPSDNHVTSNDLQSQSTTKVTDDSLLDHDNAQQNHGDVSTKSSVLDLSKISLSPDVDDEVTEKIFSKELQKKIAASKQAQKDYLKGTKRETSYPITEDADGTRYVNIKGVCWRMPKNSSNNRTNSGWAIVFDGCGLKSKSFNFELNISPSMLTNELLGPDSPFTLEK